MGSELGHALLGRDSSATVVAHSQPGTGSGESASVSSYSPPRHCPFTVGVLAGGSYSGRHAPFLRPHDREGGQLSPMHDNMAW